MNYFQFVGPSILAAFAVGFLGVFRSFPQLRSALWFSLSYACIALALTLDFLRHNFDPIAATYLTNIPYLATAVFFATGIRQLCDQPTALNRSLSIAVPVFVLLIYFRHFDPDIVKRTLVVTLGVPTIIILAIWDVWHPYKKGLLRVFLWMMVTVCVLSVLRTGLALSYENSFLTTDNYPQSATAVALQVSTSVSALIAAIVLLLIFGLRVAALLTTEAEQKQNILKNQFSQFLSPAVVDNLLAGKEKLDLSVEDKTLSILLIDLRGFTAFVDANGSEAGARVVNRFFKVAAREISERDGTIDKYLGDGILAFWNAPLEQTDHASRAFETAMAIVAKLEEESFSLPAVAIVDSGQCSVGNFGTKERLDYTAIGPTVNTVARLETHAKNMNVRVLIGGGAAALLDRDLKAMGKIPIKGISEPVLIFTPN